MPTSASTAATSRELGSVLARLERALAGLDELPPMDEARFLETHEIYEGRSCQQGRIVELLGERLAGDVPADRPARVLSVGAGNGAVDVPLARRLAAETEELHYVAVDPNRLECEALESAFAEAALPGVTVEVAARTIEDFDTPHRFDLVHFVHCLYYMPDPVAMLERAREMLVPGGELAVVHAPRGELNDLAARFYDKQYGRRTLFADDLAEILDHRAWDYERGRIDARIDVTPLVEGDPELGAALRDFVVQIDGRRLPAPVQELVERYLRLIASEDDGRAFVDHPVDAFFIAG